jgi:hypothetical protein
MSTKINIRSPYYVTLNESPATLELRVWTGESSAVPTNPDYTLTKDAINGYATFEVSELIRDYLDVTFDGTYTSQALWVRTEATTPVIAFDGYTEFKDGVNAQGNLKQLISNTTIWVPEGVDVRVPVFAQGASYNVVFKRADDATINTVAITAQTNTNALINYATSTIQVGEDVATVEVGTTTLTVRQMECSKYAAYKVVFVNKHGALQDLYFFQKSIKSLSTSKETYKANNITLGSSATYSTTAHQYRNIDIQGRESIVLSTGFVSEDYNAPIQEMMLSEKVWMVDPQDNVIPVNVKTSDVTFRTSLNDKMVEYQVEFEYAYDAINNVR